MRSNYISISLAIWVFIGLISIAYPAQAYIAAALFASALLFSSIRYNYLACTINYCTILIYYFIPPIFQISYQLTFWGLSTPSVEAYGEVLIVMCLYCVGFDAASAKIRQTPAFEYKNYSNKSFSYLGVRILVVCSISFLLLVLNPDLNFTSRGLVVDINTRPAQTFILSALPKMVLCAGVSYIFLLLRRKYESFLVVLAAVLIVVAIIGASPSTTARQILLIGLLPACYFGAKKYSSVVTAAVILLGVVMVGPFVNYLSRSQYYGGVAEFYPLSPDFDAIFISSALMEIYDRFDVGWGRYTLAAASFFLPREIKMFPSFDPLQGFGGDLFVQSNVSLPPFMTFYLDFGLMGVVAGGFLVGLILLRCEIIIREFGVDRSSVSPHKAGVAVAVLASYVPFLRGPILGWGLFFLAGLTAFGLIGFILGLKNWNSNEKQGNLS